MRYELIKKFRKKLYKKMISYENLSMKVKAITNNILLDQKFPFIHIGKISLKDWSNKTMFGLKLSFPIIIFSKKHSSEELDEISRLTINCLNDWNDIIETKYLIKTSIANSENDYLPKREIYRNILYVKTSMEEMENE